MKKIYEAPELEISELSVNTMMEGTSDYRPIQDDDDDQSSYSKERGDSYGDSWKN